MYGDDMLQKLVDQISTIVIGKREQIELSVICLLADGHLLIEDIPGVGKTTLAQALARSLGLSFSRVQFTADLLPSDLLGVSVYERATEGFVFHPGPVFAQVLLADEINRAGPRTQSALLEAMEERQVTLGDTTYPLEDPFLVLATQNPIEQEGTYPLPEAQMDRFMLKVAITYPSRDEELEVMRRAGHAGPPASLRPLLHPDDIVRMRSLVDLLYLDEKIEKYILDLVFATREPARYGYADLQRWIAYGASPRASINLTLAARAMALLRGRSYAVPQDIKDVAPDVLRHRIIPSFEADAEGVGVDGIIDRLLAETAVP